MSSLIMDLSGLLPLGEKSKALHLFVTRAEKHEVSKILEDCKDLSSFQYKKLKLLLADKFHRFDLMIELLHDGDRSILRNVVSKRWLYEGEENTLVDSVFLLNELFPNVSLICRQKVLHKIGRYVQNEAAVDRIWNAIEQKYGFDAAVPLLQACSEAKINSVIGQRKVYLSGYQVVQILRKYPSIGLKYFKENDVKTSQMNIFCSPLRYLYQYRLDDFADLCINQRCKIGDFKFGKRRSKNLIRACREKLLEHPIVTGELLKIDQIQREFSSEDYQTLFESSLPKNPARHGYYGTMNESMWKWVNAVPPYKQIDLVNKAFMNKFQINLDQHPEFMDVEYMLLLPEEKRLSVVEWNIGNEASNNWSFKRISACGYNDEKRERAWLTIKPISHSAPELTKLLLIEQDVHKRAKLSKYLILTCYINEDLPQLLRVLILLNKRSRNDQKEVRDAIFETLCDVMKVMEFSKEHWDNIVEIIQVSLVFRNDEQDSCNREKEMLIRKCLAFHLKLQLPLDKLVTMHIKLKIQCGQYTWKNCYIKNPADERNILEYYVKELENLQLTNNLRDYNGESLSDKKLTKFIMNLIEEIHLFNIDQRKTENLEPILISSHPWLATNLERIVKEEEARIDDNCKLPVPSFRWEFVERLLKIILWQREKQGLVLDVFTDPKYLFSRKLICSPNRSAILHFLQKDPSHLLHNWSTILPKMLESKECASSMRILKRWNYSSIVVQSINKCSQIISEGFENITEVNVKQNAVLVLSILKEPSDFLTLLAKFYPPENEVYPVDQSGEDYEKRATFAKAIKNVTVPHLTFEPLKKFCVGHYLKPTINSLYAQIIRAASGQSLNFLRGQLSNVPVELRKHIIRLYCRITSVDDKINILKEIESSNVSIRHVTFLEANKLFRSSPSQETWTILKAMIETTTVGDALTLKEFYFERKSKRRVRGCSCSECLYRTKPELMDIIPLEYLSEYIDVCFSLLRNIQPETVQKFLDCVEIVMDKLPEKTLDDIVMYDHENKKSFNSDFCVKYLESSSSESILEHRLSNMWTVLTNFIDCGWNEKKLESRYSSTSWTYPTRSLVSKFIQKLCIGIRSPAKARLQNQICGTLLENMKTKSTVQFFMEILYLELALLLVKGVEYSGIKRLRSFGRSLAEFVDSLVEQYGGEIIFIARDKVKDYIECSFNSEFRKNAGMVDEFHGMVELVDEIFQTSKSRQNKILSIALLDQNVKPEDANQIQMLEKANKVLNESNDVIIQIYLSSSL